MKSSVELFNEIRAMKAEQAAVPRDAEDYEAQVLRYDGRIEQAEAQLADVLKTEDEARAQFMTAGRVVSAQAQKSITEMAFGPRAEFKGVEPGFRAAVTVPSGPTVVDPNIPGFPDFPRGFVDTLPSATTSGAVAYLRRVARTNAAAQWGGVSAKPESSYEWIDATAPLAYVAHHTPIAKAQASDWGQLDGLIRNELMLGLMQAKSTEALTGANAGGITGVLNTTGILTHEVATGDNVYDAIRRMVTKVFITSGFRPTTVAMAPQVREQLDLLKSSTDGHYLAINVGNTVWGLEVVEDNGLTFVDTAVPPSAHYGMVVYASVGATWYTKEQDTVEIGLVNDQFVKNAYTLLAEGRHALAVRFPDAFCYCQDAIPAVAV